VGEPDGVNDLVEDDVGACVPVILRVGLPLCEAVVGCVAVALTDAEEPVECSRAEGVTRSSSAKRSGCGSQRATGSRSQADSCSALRLASSNSFDCPCCAGLGDPEADCVNVNVSGDCDGDSV